MSSLQYLTPRRRAHRCFGTLQVGLLLAIVSLPAQAQPTHLSSLTTGVIDTIVYSIVGIAMATIGFKVVDWLTPGGLSEEIAHKENRALAIVAGSMILGICIIIAGVITEG